MKIVKCVKKKIRGIATIINMRIMRIKGITYIPPNYIYIDKFNERSNIIDVGCGIEAEFSIQLIKNHKLTAFGVDPTKKHAPFLKILEENTNGKFNHLSAAVTSQNGFITFNESRQNESGSISLDHINVQNDNIITYEIESFNLKELVKRIGVSNIDLIKLDLEGAEYDLLNEITYEELKPFDQIFVEFHHHCTNHTQQETKIIVRNIRSKGFNVFTLDKHNYLFYKK